MSIKLMAQLWETADASGSELLVLLALADFANDDGSSIFPAMPTIAKKARLSVDQARRVVHKLIEANVLELVEQGGWIGKRNRPNEYRILMQGPGNLPGPDADTRTLQSPKEGGGTRVDARGVPAPVQEDPSLDPPIELREEEELHAREPLSVAWRQAYGDAKMPPKLAESLKGLAVECSMAAAIHGIKASAAKEDGRNFRYIAECARNYVPPAPVGSVNGNGAYHVDIAGVHVLLPLQQPTPALPTAKPPPPMAHDDPWAVALAEILPTLTPHAQLWLRGSTLRESGMLAGVPLYRVTAMTEPGNVGWLTQQAEPLIRKTLSSIFHKRLLVEILAAEQELLP